jgi:cell division transport system ATP-binding protein
MLKREDEHRETREAPAAPFAAVLDPPAPALDAVATPQLTRAERLAALAAEDERAPRAPQRPGTPMIVFEKTSLVYPGDHVGLRSISLTIDKGEWVFLVGPSGSGKSTFIKLLLRELRATEGSVLVGGRSLEKLRRSKVPQLRRNIGCVFQDFKLLPNRNVYQNVAYALEVQGEDHHKIEHKVPEILQLVGLGEKLDRLPHETSVGILQLLYRINRSGTTVVMATHDREMVDKMRRRVIALERGRLVRDDRRGGYV